MMVLPASAPEKWEYRQHMRVKHSILSKYLDGWIRHLGSTRKRLLYFDGFAGRGVYESGEAGSPIIAMRIARKDERLFSEFHCFAIEKDRANFDGLVSAVSHESLEDNKVKFHPINAEFADTLNDLFQTLEREKSTLAPSFFFVDPFGFGGVPFEVVTRILAYPTTEILLTFMSRDISRFLESAPHAKAVEVMFGMKIPEEILNYDLQRRQDWLVGKYRELLSSVAQARFTWVYRVSLTERREIIYHLIHASNHFKALKLMKDVMFREGAKGEFTYFGPDEEKFGNQQLRLWEFNIDSFQRYLLERFKGQTRTFFQIMEDSYTDTPYVEPQYRAALKSIRDQKLSSYLPCKPHPKGGLDYDDCFTFP
jgi:three-Cys-motif partner protein